ncbi:MAG: LysR family transcriptional regulator [Oscillochloris sp.]|nr:LysR family transcriptional regulator [Oscillochloris sp.]
MELRHLIYFEAVARHEHVSRAALELAIAQPAITKQLKDLERELGGGPLFQRVGRRIRLTPAGHALLNHTRMILAQVTAARDEVREYSGNSGGRVVIGAPPSVGERLLPEVLRQFHREAQTVELHVVEGDTNRLLQCLDDLTIDMAVVTMPLVQRGLQVSPLFEEELVVALSAEHPLAAQAEIRAAELVDERFLFYAAGYVREATLHACRQAGFTPHTLVSSGSLEMVLRLAAADLGIAVVPRLAMDARAGLVMRPLREPTIRRTMAVVSREGRAFTPAAARMHDHLVATLSRHRP